MPLKGLNVYPPPVDTEPGPCASALNPWGVFLLDRTMCVWSSNTNKSRGGPFSSRAAGSNNSVWLTLKLAPYTSFIARKDAAMPPVPWRN